MAKDEKMNKLKLFSIIGQWLAGIAGFVGIGIELAFKAHWGYVLITLCGVLGYVSTKIRHEYGSE